MVLGHQRLLLFIFYKIITGLPLLYLGLTIPLGFLLHETPDYGYESAYAYTYKAISPIHISQAAVASYQYLPYIISYSPHLMVSPWVGNKKNQHMDYLLTYYILQSPQRMSKKWIIVLNSSSKWGAPNKAASSYRTSSNSWARAG